MAASFNVLQGVVALVPPVEAIVKGIEMESSSDQDHF